MRGWIFTLLKGGEIFDNDSYLFDGGLVTDHFFVCCWSYLVGVGLGNKQKLRSEISQIKKNQITKNENQGSLLLNRMWCVLLVQLGFLNWWGLHIIVIYTEQQQGCWCYSFLTNVDKFYWQKSLNQNQKNKKREKTRHTLNCLI
jgi:hypothetical protein